MRIHALKSIVAVAATIGATATVNAQEEKEVTPVAPTTEPAAPVTEQPPPTTPTIEPRADETLPPCPNPNLPECPKTVVVPAAEPAPVAHKEKHHNVIFAPETLSLTTGAGVNNYFGSGMPTGSDPGAAWDVRVTSGARSIIALEAGYVGSLNNLDAPSGTQGKITSNGLDGDLRLQLPTRVQPYIFAGVGYNHMSINREANPTLMARYNHEDNQLTVPAGGGLSAYIGRHATLDLRGTYRLMTNNDIFVFNTGAIHQWSAQANIGYTF